MNTARNTLVYAAKISALSEERAFAVAYNAVSERRRKKTDALRFDKDKYLSLGAELLLRKALKDFGAPVKLVDCIENGENGKPFFSGGEDIFFNLSHSGEYVLCAVSDGEVGCDIEEIKDLKESLAKRIFSETEYSDIMSKNTAKERSAEFFRYWTLRESYIKFTGQGLSLPLSDFFVTRENGTDVLLNGKRQNVFFSGFTDIPGYACAVCTRSREPARLKIFTVRFSERGICFT